MQSRKLKDRNKPETFADSRRKLGVSMPEPKGKAARKREVLPGCCLATDEGDVKI